MNDFIKIISVVIIACLAATALKEIKREYSVYIPVFCGVLVLLYAVNKLMPVKETVENIAALSDIGESSLKIFFKAVGITAITSITSDACLDSGNRFLASCVELCGKAAVTLSAMPLINSVVSLLSKYMGVGL